MTIAKINLGNNKELSVSKIGLGLWQASNAWNGDDNEIIKGVGRAKEIGITLVDTAEGYGSGHSESVLGKALNEYGRLDYFVATKVSGAHLRYKELQRACDQSRKRLGVEKLDLYQIHWPDPWEQIPFKETFKAMSKLYEDGKIRSIGVSNFAVRDLEEAQSILGDVKIVSNQVRYNLLQRNIEEEVMPYCRKNHINIIAWSPLAQGVLSGKYHSAEAPKGDVREGNELFNRKNLDATKSVIGKLSEISKKYSMTPSQVALNWLSSQDGVIPIPGAKNVKQVEENAASLRIKLTERELGELSKISKEIEIDYLPN